MPKPTWSQSPRRGSFAVGAPGLTFDKPVETRARARLPSRCARGSIMPNTAVDQSVQFTDRDVRLIIASLPGQIDVRRRELFPRLLREWAARDLREHLSREASEHI